MDNETLTDVLKRLSYKRKNLYTDEEMMREIVSKNPIVLDMIQQLDMTLIY